MSSSCIAFIGGGNMAAAILGGLLRHGAAADSLVVIEPSEPQRAKLLADLGVAALPAADATLARASTVVWAVKPQMFAQAAAPCAAQVSGALQLSIMAGIRSDAIVAATGSARVVRSMPNTPALIGRGIAGLYARDAVSAAERAEIEQLLAPTGSTVWVDREADLDAVTALSGSGPAYVFYFIEAMVQAGTEMGLSAAQARQLAQETFAGAAALAMASDESPTVLRERVTSKGGTTAAELDAFAAAELAAAIAQGVNAAAARGGELCDLLGQD